MQLTVRIAVLMERHTDWMAAGLEQLRAADALRKLEVRASAGGRFQSGGREWLNFASNDYLDLVRHPRVIAAASAL